MISYVGEATRCADRGAVGYFDGRSSKDRLSNIKWNQSALNTHYKSQLESKIQSERTGPIEQTE